MLDKQKNNVTMPCKMRKISNNIQLKPPGALRSHILLAYHSHQMPGGPSLYINGTD